MAQRVTTTETTDEPDRSGATATVDRDHKVNKVEAVVWFILAVVLAIILVRFVMLLLGARTGVPFVDFWYNLSVPFVKPFSGIWTLDTTNDYTGMRFEPESVVAMLIYALIAYLIVLAVRLLKNNPTERSA